jgi:polyphosphate kinase
VIRESFLPEHFINRELSWLEFNARVLEEAQEETTPLLERVKFLSIFSSNLDEFFMVRVAGLREQAFESAAAQDANADEIKPAEQLRQVCVRTRQLVDAQYKCLSDSVLPALDHHGVRLVGREEAKDHPQLSRVFRETIYPVLTPMAIDPSHPRPRYHNRGLYLAAMLTRRSGLGPKSLFAVVQIPQVLPRLVPVDVPEGRAFIFLEELVAARLPELFGGFEVRTRACFRVTRDSDIETIEQESDDMLRMIEERLRARRRADAVRLEISADADAELVDTLVAQEQLRPGRSEHDYSEIYRIPGPLDLTGLGALLKIDDRDDLRDRGFTPQWPRGLRRGGEALFRTIAGRDVLLHHPYDSFEPVVEFVAAAAADPRVLAIKQTLYRTSGDSPIVRSLMSAAEQGKHVTALVEVKARFDEEANVSWARQMERAGVHVVYGFLDLKTHCKVSLVVRQEEGGLRRYVHLGTGNYNPTTARIYTDVGLFSAEPALAEDVSALFNLLTGYSQGHPWSKLVVAPNDLHRRTIQLIEEQTRLAHDGKPARIYAKLNSLVDRRTIEALYRASQAGVSVELLVRGICCLRPQIAGLSENIRVTSIVDRFLEHSRLYVFGVGAEAKIFLASADWMPRNFYRRVEVMFPIESELLKQRIVGEIIPTYMKDNVKARVLRADGTYARIKHEPGEPAYRSQEEFLKLHLALGPEKAYATNGSPAALAEAKEEAAT